MIRSIRVENFKSIKEANLVLPKFGVIIGKNGSGKSTLLYAISLTQKLASGLNLTESLKVIAPLTNELFHFNSDRTNSTIEVIIETSKQAKFKLAYSLSLNATTKRLVISDEILYSMQGKNTFTVYKRVTDGVITYPSSGEVHVPLKTDIDKLSLGGYSSPEVAEVASIISNYTIIDNPEKTEGVNTVSGEHPNLKTLDGVLVSLFNKNQQAFQDAVKATQQIIPDFNPPTVGDLTKFYTDNSIPNDKNTSQLGGNPQASITQDGGTSPSDNLQNEGLKSYAISYKEKQYGKSYTSISLSGGNLRTIYLIFSLFNTQTFSFFAVEEIENGMHSDRVFKLIDQFRTQSNNRKVQMLFTTHSLDLLNYVIPQEMIYCTKTAQEGSEYKIIADMEEYKQIKEELGRKSLTGKDIIDSGLFS